MPITIDDAGVGDLLFGVIIGAFREETQEFRYEVLDVKYFRSQRFRRKEPPERKLIVHKIIVDLETVRNVIVKDKTRFFAKLGFLKPKHEEIECESVLLFYEPFLMVKANYFLDYYENKSYRTKVGDNATEVVVFGQTLKPEVISERTKGVLKKISQRNRLRRPRKSNPQSHRTNRP